MRFAAPWKGSNPMLLIQDALKVDAHQCTLHPELEPWKSVFSRAKKHWIKHEPMSALQWYVWQQGWHEPLASLLASKLDPQQQAGAKQYWVVTPYYASLRQARIAVMPEHLLAWTLHDAQWLVALLNPMLEAYGINLFLVGSSIIAKSDRFYDVDMVDFSKVSGGFLPDKKPKGIDSLRFMCMLSEMQAILAQHGTEHRDLMISGVWFWGMAEKAAQARAWSHISTHQKSLLSLLDEGEIKAYYTDVDHLDDLANIPQYCVLAGHETSVLLEHAILPRWSKKTWKIKKIKSLDQIHAKIFS